MAQEVGGIVFVTFNEKVDCLVDTIKELGRLPRMYDKDGTPECLFADETNQRAFYERVLGKYYLIRHKDAQNLTKNEVDTLNGCLKIREALDEIYIMKNQKNIDEFNKKVEEYIGYIDECIEKKIPIDKENKFSDGTKQYFFYVNLLNYNNKLPINRTLSIEEKIKKEAFSRITTKVKELKRILFLDKYEKSLAARADELIDTITKIKRLPKSKMCNNFESEYVFSDGSDQRGFYYSLKHTYNETRNKEELTEKEKIAVKYLEKIEDCINSVGAKESELINDSKEQEENRKMLEHTSTFITTILELGRLPKKRTKNGYVSEYVFEDGIDQRWFYDNLKGEQTRIKNKRIKKTSELIATECVNNINWYVGFIHARNYYETYNDLNVITGYVSKLDDNKIELKEWLDEQRELYKLEEKTNIQLEHEKLLNDLCENWYLASKEENDKKIVKKI